ncbi:MAG: hypothetical protein V1709_06925, partial [Planctomycetota bacterium]
MIKTTLLTILFLLSPYLLLFSQEVTAFTPIKTEDAIINSIDFQTGLEVLRYQEAGPISNTLSKSEIRNIVGSFNICQEYQQVQGGIKGILPLNIYQNTEKWYANDINFRLNKLDYYWSRIDAYVGYSFKDDYFTVPGTWYTGFRRSESIQHRSDFIISGTPQNTKSTAKIQSYGLFIGYKGESTLVETRQPAWSDNLAPLILLDWRLEYHKPIFNRVTDSSIPDALFKDKVGYTTDFKMGSTYHITPALSATFSIYGGRMYWKGSPWENFGSGPVKWNENKTDYLGANLG